MQTNLPVLLLCKEPWNPIITSVIQESSWTKHRYQIFCKKGRSFIQYYTMVSANILGLAALCIDALLWILNISHPTETFNVIILLIWNYTHWLLSTMHKTPCCHWFLSYIPASIALISTVLYLLEPFDFACKENKNHGNKKYAQDKWWSEPLRKLLNVQLLEVKEQNKTCRHTKWREKKTAKSSLSGELNTPPQLLPKVVVIKDQTQHCQLGEHFSNHYILRSEKKNGNFATSYNYLYENFIISYFILPSTRLTLFKMTN